MVREWDQKRRCFSVSVDKSHGWETGQLAGAVPKQVPNLTTTTQFVLFLSFQRLLHIATSYYFGIFNYCCADTCLGEALPSFLPTHSLVFLPDFSLLLLLLPPSPVFSIPTSSDLCTFTKIQETHKGIWVLSLKNLFKHVTHYTIPTQKAHYTGCPKTSTSWINHTFWIQADSSAQIIASQMIMRTQQSSLLLVPCSYMDFLPLISSFLHIFLPEVLPLTAPFSPLPRHFYSPLPTQQWGSTDAVSERSPWQAEILLDLCFLPLSGTGGAQLDQQEAGQWNRGSSNAGSIRQGWPD